MDVVGSEIGQKMRSAIKAKLTELGCYVDDELPDYVMVMVANKRTRAQMEGDLQLFLCENTEMFVSWLHQVLKKLQEVTVAAPITTSERSKSKERSTSKERKSKEKKDKQKDKLKKSDHLKNVKNKEKAKLQKKKQEKVHKSKKKSKHESIRPNIPPLLMNIEKVSEPSITDVFAGQILKNHGVTLDIPKEELVLETKPVIKEKRPLLPIIDPATISSQPDPTLSNDIQQPTISVVSIQSEEEQLNELNEIEAKIQGLKQKLLEQSDIMSDDEDFLNIRTEAEELMNDFVEEQEMSQLAVTATPPIKSPSPIHTELKSPEHAKETPTETIEVLPQIELNLPKRPVRERIGMKEGPKKILEAKITEKITSPERFTPEREPEPKKSAKARLGELPQRKSSLSDNNEKSDSGSKKERLTSKVSILEKITGRSCASVVRVRPRPRGPMPNSTLLLRAVAEAHKSLLNAPIKTELESRKVKRALVHPMRRADAPNIVIQVPVNATTHDTADNVEVDIDDDCSKLSKEITEKEYLPIPITKRINNTEYLPSGDRRDSRTATKRDDTIVVETINIHSQTIDKEKKTQFIVTMDGYHPNAFLAKKLLSEGLLEEEGELLEAKDKKESPKEKTVEKETAEPTKELIADIQEEKTTSGLKKRLSDTSEESDTQVIIKQEITEKRKSVEPSGSQETPPNKKRRASPIVFDVDKKEKDRETERTESVSSDNHVTITKNTGTHKYDTLPSLSQAKRALVPCRSFPACRYGASCAFQHPRCKFAAACTRRNCPYLHAAPTPPLASHVVPAANYKSISTASTVNQMCKFYPNCVNPACHYFHPKSCRYGATCMNKLVCNFYHPDPAGKWRYPV